MGTRRCSSHGRWMGFAFWKLTAIGKKSNKQKKSTKVKVIKGDLLSLDVDAIVNPANNNLNHGGGIAGQIVRRGGVSIQEESDSLSPIKTGHAVITSAGKLPARFVIHAVGPRMGEGGEEEKLYNAISNSLRVAQEKGLTTIAIPAISTGIFGYPSASCAKIMKKALSDFLEKETTLKKIIVCLYEDDKYRIFLREFSRESS
jgi:O-acetyl-ADP-ribose deacetylase (regulator of RNase III)